MLHLLKKRETALAPLLRALEAVDERLVDLRHLRQCRHASIPARSAPIRAATRALLCVVEEVADLWALDRSRLFPGRFHVLGGRLSALEGVRPEDLTIDSAGRPRRGGRRSTRSCWR